MSKHTPGPWHIGCGNGEGCIFSDEGRMRMEEGGTTLHSIAIVCKSWEEEEDSANARLIAAAPELLEALQAMVKHADECKAYWEENDCPLDTKEHGLAVFMNCRAGDKVRDAIAKATGTEQ